MTTSIDQLRTHVDILNTAVCVQPITKGYSEDEKYLVVTDSGNRLLLRVMPLDQYQRKQTEFQILRQMHSAHIQVPEPIAFGRLDDLGACYYVLSYIDGLDAENALPEYAEEVQYQIGVEAGRDLRRMHEYSAPQNVSPWYQRCAKKHCAYVEAYKSIGVTIKRAHRILEFIEDNQRYIQNRPNRFQHDDFHTANIIVRDGKYAGTIDFNRYDWGDPVHDLLKVGFFTSEVSVPFSVGQLHGYFDNGRIPDHFWNMYATYLAMTLFSSVVWTMRVVPHQMDNMLDRIQRVLEDHQYFESAIPTWYSESW